MPPAEPPYPSPPPPPPSAPPLICGCTDYRQGAGPKQDFLCQKSEGPDAICVPSFRSGTQIKHLPLAIRMAMHYCPSSDFAICQNGLPPPAAPPAPPTAPEPPAMPSPPGKPPRSPKPSPPPVPPGKPPGTPHPPPAPAHPPLAPGITATACTNQISDKKCLRKASKNKCQRFKIAEKCKLTCNALCVR